MRDKQIDLILSLRSRRLLLGQVQHIADGLLDSAHTSTIQARSNESYPERTESLRNSTNRHRLNDQISLSRPQ